jgi:hypothetical protein
MAAGRLEISGGAGEEISAQFRYTESLGEPDFRFDNTTFRANLTVASKRDSAAGKNVENRWTLQIPNRAATDLTVKMGAGEADLRLGSIDLRRVSFNVGAGKVDLDLRGTPKHDYEVEVNGGVGECRVTVPASVGVRAEAAGGLGSMDIQGLSKKNGAYENEAFSGAGPKIRLQVRGGVGAIHIIAE